MGNAQKGKLRLLGPAAGQEKRRGLLADTLSCILPEDRAELAASGLLERFGGLTGVLYAPKGELAQSPGMGEEAARLLALVMELARGCMEEQAADLQRIYDTKSAAEAFRPKLLGRNTEAVCLMLLDGRGRMLYNHILSEGSVSEVPLYVRKLVRMCIDYEADAVFLAHNHPSGNAMPSRNDLVATRQVEMALESIDARLQDHLIFAGEDYFSFSASTLWTRGREQLRAYRKGELDAARKLERELLQKQGR